VYICKLLYLSHMFELDDGVSVEEFQKILDLSKENIIDHIKKK